MQPAPHRQPHSCIHTGTHGFSSCGALRSALPPAGLPVRARRLRATAACSPADCSHEQLGGQRREAASGRASGGWRLGAQPAAGCDAGARDRAPRRPLCQHYADPCDPGKVRCSLCWPSRCVARATAERRSTPPPLTPRRASLFVPQLRPAAALCLLPLGGCSRAAHHDGCGSGQRVGRHAAAAGGRRTGQAQL